MTQPAAAGPAPALRYDAWFDNPWRRYAWRIETRAVLRALGPLAGRRIADIGCGTGRLLRILTSNGAKAVGIDTDPAMVTLTAPLDLSAWCHLTGHAYLGPVPAAAPTSAACRPTQPHSPWRLTADAG